MTGDSASPHGFIELCKSATHLGKPTLLRFTAYSEGVEAYMLFGAKNESSIEFEFQLEETSIASDKFVAKGYATIGAKRPYIMIEATQTRVQFDLIES